MHASSYLGGIFDIEFLVSCSRCADTNSRRLNDLKGIFRLKLSLSELLLL